MVGPGKAKPILGLFKCSWLDLGAGLAVSEDWWAQSEHEVHRA
jgi:hypothetical protein